MPQKTGWKYFTKQVKAMIIFCSIIILAAIIEVIRNLTINGSVLPYSPSTFIYNIILLMGNLLFDELTSIFTGVPMSGIHIRSTGIVEIIIPLGGIILFMIIPSTLLYLTFKKMQIIRKAGMFYFGILSLISILLFVGGINLILELGEAWFSFIPFIFFMVILSLVASISTIFFDYFRKNEVFYQKKEK